MPIDFDPAKNTRNITERGLSFELAWDFDFAEALVIEDDRFRYPERRWLALGPLTAGFRRGRLMVIVFTPVHGRIRIISLRKANERERRHYEEIGETP